MTSYTTINIHKMWPYRPTKIKNDLLNLLLTKNLLLKILRLNRRMLRIKNKKKLFFLKHKNKVTIERGLSPLAST